MHALTLIGSARRGGNAETLARAAMASAPDYTWTTLHLDDYPLPPFRDARHDDELDYAYPAGHAATLLEATLRADLLLLAVPLYWYNLPATAKLYLDHWSHWLRVPGLDFRERMAGKRLYATCAMSSPRAAEAEPPLASLRLTAAYLGMVWGGHVLAHANHAGRVAKDAAKMAEARALIAV